MNILELIRKNDPNVLVQYWDSKLKQWCPHADPQSLFIKFKKLKFKFFGLAPVLSQDLIHGLMLRSGMRVVIRHAAQYWPNYAQGNGVFKFSCLGNTKTASLNIGWSSGDDAVLTNREEVVVNNELTDITIPPAPSSELDLLVHAPLQKGIKIFFGIYRMLDRRLLYTKCKGNGVEIGPGPKPQIHPGIRTKVKYIEQSTPDQWRKLYGQNTKVPVDPELWKHYEVGNANNISVLRESLDFIFSSHVIEHLANPLGHLAYWSTLLKTGGIIAAVIPDRDGCKDYIFRPSTIEELDEEFRIGSMEPTLAHYQRWGECRAPKTDSAEILKSGRSIHVHFYTPRSMNQILHKTYQKLGFRQYKVICEQNHKDFFILLTK